MPIPLIVYAGAALGGVLISVGSGYILEKTIGDGDYSGRDLAIDSGLGLIPGAALVKPGAKILASARHLRHFDRSVDTLRGATAGIVYYNRRNLAQIGIHQSATVLIGGAYDRLTSGSSGTSATGAVTRPSKTKKFPGANIIVPRKLPKGASGRSRTGLACPPGYKLQKHRGRWMCIRG